MHAMVVEAAAGTMLDVDDLIESRAWAWGQALAAVHQAAAGIDAGLPVAFGQLVQVPERFGDDPALVKAAARLGSRLAALARDHSRFGVIHGDFELDNLAWEGERVTAFDFDEAAVCWYAADIAYAVRVLTDPVGHPLVERQGLFAAFVAGYRIVRPLDDADLASLRLFTGVHAVCALVRIDQALGVPGEDEPAWLAELRAKLAVIDRSHGELAIAIAEDV